MAECGTDPGLDAVIPYGRQSIDESDIEAVVAVLRGDWLTQGPAVEEFEHALTATTGASFAVAFANGTAALHGAMVAAGLGSEHTVATSPLSFAASATSARMVGAGVAFVDIDENTLNLDITRLPRCDALVAVHYAGLPLDLAQLPRRPRVVIEDAAHALGARTANGPVGNCARSDMCMFSFHPVKTVTTAEGGAVTTNSPELADRLRRFRNHGIVRRPEMGGWYYEIPELGFNYRLTDVHAALGTSQLRRIESFVERRNELAARYRARLAHLNLRLPPAAPPGWRHAYHLFVIRVRQRRRVYDALRERGVGVQVHFIPIYRHPLLAQYASPSDYPVTERVYGQTLSLPLFPDLTFECQDVVISALEEVL